MQLNYVQLLALMVAGRLAYDFWQQRRNAQPEFVSDYGALPNGLTYRMKPLVNAEQKFAYIDHLMNGKPYAAQGTLRK
jgi:hypothetical protein